MKDMFIDPFLRKNTFIVVMMMIMQQFSGINAVMFFSTGIFKNAGLEKEEAKLATVIVGVVNVAMTVVSMFIVDKAGRKKLLIAGYAGMAPMTLALVFATQFQHEVVAYFSIAFVCIFVIFFAIGPGSIPWFFVSELFMQDTRPRATTICVATNWICTVIIGLSFESLQKVFQGYVFLFFFVFLLSFVAYIAWYVPETKGKTIEMIQKELYRKYGMAEPGASLEEIGAGGGEGALEMEKVVREEKSERAKDV